MKNKSVLFLVIFSLLIACNQSKTETIKVKKTAPIINAKKTKSVKFNEYVNKSLPRIKDDPKLEKQKVVIYTTADRSLVYTKNDIHKIEILFPLFKSSVFSNPDEAYEASGVWKEYMNQDEKKETFDFGSEDGQDNFYLVYAYYLKQKNGDAKFSSARKNLITLYDTLNDIYSRVEYGGTFFGHQYDRIYGYAEYSIYLLAINKKTSQRIQFNKHKAQYIDSLQKYVAGKEENNVYNKMDEKEGKERAKYFEKKIAILQRLITNYYYLDQLKNFDTHYR